MLEAFKDIVLDISAIGTHSLKSGRAIATANAGVPDRFLSVMAAGLVNRLRTGIFKILYLHVCRFLKFKVFSFLVCTAF